MIQLLLSKLLIKP